MRKSTVFSTALLMVLLFTSCKKDVVADQTSSLIVTTPRGGETFHTGEFVTIKWKSANLPANSVVIATITNKIPNRGTVGIRLHPQNNVVTTMDGTTSNDGEESFQLPWKFSDEGRLLYENTLSTKSFKVELVVLHPDSSGVWSVGDKIIEGVSNDFFTIIPSTLPDGCLTVGGYSTTTGQPCH